MLMVLSALIGLAVFPLQAEEALSRNGPARFMVQAKKESPLSSVVAGRIAKVKGQRGGSVAAGKVRAALVAWPIQTISKARSRSSIRTLRTPAICRSKLFRSFRHSS